MYVCVLVGLTWWPSLPSSQQALRLSSAPVSCSPMRLWSWPSPCSLRERASSSSRRLRTRSFTAALSSRSVQRGSISPAALPGAQPLWIILLLQLHLRAMFSIRITVWRRLFHSYCSLSFSFLHRFLKCRKTWFRISKWRFEVTPFPQQSYGKSWLDLPVPWHLSRRINRFTSQDRKVISCYCDSYITVYRKTRKSNLISQHSKTLLCGLINKVW